MAQRRARGSNRQNERFSSVPPSRIPRSAFDRSHTHKTTFDSGKLVPVYLDEMLPGDTISLRPSFFARMATPFQPFMDGLHLDYQFFACPVRLVWENFVRMMGEKPDPADHIDYTVPQMTAPVGGHLVGSLSDYFGLPTEVAGYDHHSLFHRMYNLVYQEWYRDENLQDQVDVPTDDGPDLDTEFPIRRRGKRKDYFTGALPFLQKGDAVTLPLGDTAPVDLTFASSTPTFTGSSFTGGPQQLYWDNSAANVTLGGGTFTGDSSMEWGNPGITAEADLSTATAATINTIRQAVAVQHLLERDARGGTRYRELVLSHFGVQTDDIRLLRPQLLATGSVQVQVAQVPKTAVNFIGEAVGQLGAFATASQVGRGFVYSATEHTLLMGIVSVRAELTYQQGLPRMFSRETRYDFYWPDLALLGEQAVLSREIYTDGSGDPDLSTGDFEVWGYQPRYEEYRHRTSMITGEFRSTYAQSLDVWHLGLDFASRPSLNNAFLEENPPVSRVIADPADTEFLLDSFFKVKHVRPMPKFAKPGLLRF